VTTNHTMAKARSCVFAIKSCKSRNLLKSRTVTTRNKTGAGGHNSTKMPCQRKRILVVDDDCATQLIMKRMIEGFGYECDTASDGQEAVAAASGTNYMAIMMDLFMPVMNGCDAAVSIKKTRTRKETPAIVGMISIDEPAVRKVCVDSGMQEVMCKPIQRATLAQCLRRMESHIGSDISVSTSAAFDHQGPADEIESNRTSPSRPAESYSARSGPSRLLRRRSSEPHLQEAAVCVYRRSSTSSPNPRHP
jgi:CheY-like chemotaxis protein